MPSLLCSNKVQATHSHPYFLLGGGLGSLTSFGCSGGHQTKDLQFTRERQGVLCVSALMRHASFALGPLLSDFRVCALGESTSTPLCFHTTVHQKPVSLRRESRQCLLSHIWVVPDLHQTVHVLSSTFPKGTLSGNETFFLRLINSTASCTGAKRALKMPSRCCLLHPSVS